MYKEKRDNYNFNKFPYYVLKSTQIDLIVQV